MVQYGILCMMLALMAGLWRLQVLDVQNYRVLAEQNRIRKEPILAPRGKLFDRENRIIVDDYPSVSCFLVREQSQNVEADLPLIAKGLDLMWTNCAPRCITIAPSPDTSRFPSRRT